MTDKLNNIEDTISMFTSIELSKKLKELGVKQVSIFKWRKNIHGEVKVSRTTQMTHENGFDYSAFTMLELWNVLQEWCNKSK